MNKEKEIEEMSSIIRPFVTVLCEEDTVAEALIDAGYGNVKQAVKEFAEKLKAVFCTECDYGGGDIKETIDNLITELYGADE